MNKIDGKMSVLIALALVALCVAVRLVVDAGALPYNFAAIASASLFAGFIFKNRAIALAIPLLAMLISDAVIGYSPATTMLVVYAVLAAPVFAGAWLARKPRTTSFMVGGLCISALGASLLFFGVTNFETWLTWGMYEKSLGGLTRCYVMALPFFKWTLSSNVIFTGVFFSAAALAPILRSSMHPAEVPAR